MEPLEWRTDRQRPSAPTGAGRIHETRLPDDLARKIRELAQAEDVSLLALTMAGYQMVLNRYTGQHDIGLGSVLSGRTRSETEPMMGFFANTVAVRGDLAGNPVFRDLVHATNNAILEGWPARTCRSAAWWRSSSRSGCQGGTRWSRTCSRCCPSR